MRHMNDLQKINFASENFAGVHPEVMKALMDANEDHAPSYGRDDYTKQTIALFKEIFGGDIDVHFTFNGTGANNFGLGCVTEKFHSVFCSAVSHLYVDESTAPESFVGCRIYPVNSESGKIILDDLKDCIKRMGDLHHPQPKVVSITQPTEYGTVYSFDEIAEIKKLCIENNLLLHMDGSRFFNAAVYLGSSLKKLSADAGVDILTLGGTKAGMMFGEAVIFFGNSNPSHRFHLKRSMQLASKQRFVAAQFKVMLENDLWVRIAQHTNDLAKRFEDKMSRITAAKIAHPVQSNAVFVNMTKALYLKLQQQSNFYYWNDIKNEARFVFSFDNTNQQIESFEVLLKKHA